MSNLIRTTNYGLWTIIYGLIICLTANVVQAQGEYSTHSIPLDMQEANAVVRNHSIEYKVKSPSKASLYERKVITFFNDESDLNELHVFYNKFRKVESIAAKLYDARGKLIRKISKKEIKDYSAISNFSIYEDSRIKHLEINYSQYPYTIEFEVKTSMNGIQNHPNWYPQFFEYGVAVQNSSYRVTADKTADIRYQVSNFEPKFEQSTEGENTIYHWQIENVPPLKKELYAPNKEDIFPILKVAPTSFSLDGYNGDMSTWASFGKFIHQLNAGRGIPTENTEKIVASLTKDLETDQEKIAALYDYLQKTNRYVSVQLGIGGWKAFDTQYVEKNKYGDCKALSYYMKAMLHAADIEAYPVLIYSGNQPKTVSEDFTDPAFNHMILYVPGDDPTWLECTSTFNTPGYLGRSTENRKVLLITPEGGKLANTPTTTPAANIGDAHIKVKLGDKGEAQIEVRSTKTGAMQRSLRYKKNTLSEEKQKEELQESLEDLPAFKIDNYEVKLAENEATCELNYDLTVYKLATVQGNRMFIRPNVIHQNSFTPDKEKERKQAIVSHSAYTQKDRVEIELPQGYMPESLPEKIDIQTDFGNYKVSYEMSGNQLICSRLYEKKTYNLSPDRHQDMYDFYKQVKKADRVKAVLVKGKSEKKGKP